MSNNTGFKQRTSAQSAELDARIKRGIYEGKEMKAIAVTLGIPESYAYTLAKRRLGFTKMLLDENERALINGARAAALKMGSRRK